MYFCWLEERKVQLSSPDGGFEICMIVAAVCGKNDSKCVEEEEACLLCYCLHVAAELNGERNEESVPCPWIIPSLCWTFFSPIFIICLKIHKGSMSCSEGDCKEVSSVFGQSRILEDQGPVFLSWALLPERSFLKAGLRRLCARFGEERFVLAAFLILNFVRALLYWRVS